MDGENAAAENVANETVAPEVADESQDTITESGPRDLVPCPICGRRFRPDVLQRHENICKKVKTKKRKAFDSSKQRAMGSDIEAAPKLPQAQPKEKEKPKKKSNWREKHEEFIRTVRAAKGSSTEVDDNANVQSRVPVGYVECPTCGRHFSERAADRHIKWCGEQKSRMSKSPGSTEAAERLKARTRYRAPPPGKKGAGNMPQNSRASVKRRDRDDDASSPNADARSSNSIEGVSGSRLVPKANTKSRAVVKRNGRSKPTNASRNRETPKGKSQVASMYNMNNKANTAPSKSVMKFKEKFPNHRNILDGEDGYELFPETDEQFSELMKSNTRISHTPRTVPGVRTAGNTDRQVAADVNRNYSSGNLNQRFMGSSLEDDMAVLQARLGNLGPFRNLRNGVNTDLPNRWATKPNEPFESVGLPAVSSSESPPFTANNNNNNNNNSSNANKDKWIIDGETRSSTSGSSDGSLPPLSRGSSSEGRLPRFCHQCGTKYPVSGAKYCCECGARRLGTIATFTSAATAAT